MDTTALEFSLPNAAAEPDPFSIADLSPEIRFAVLFFQRDHYCTNCREQVQAVADRVDAFRARGAEPVSVVPEPLDRVEQWQAEYDLPYPLLADEDAAVGDAYDQPVRFGLLGSVSDFLGRMPQIVVLDRSGGEGDPEVVYTYSSNSTFDRPSIDELLATLDDLAADGETTSTDG
ncbi:thioredoxin-dependent hydroperoxide peroxidase [Halosimplex carlsbadense 2-9-1]|uniref:Thioredoxin-dependent hydroperoxide peroxidase n=1 Tax=Halosimplex carlsbadense 2-9-1 TaxID=797114 RepID=M0CFJ1_9EURY|nr:redoxin domain-containing protein [Halosimplex carlsbadense]ELZ21132.1 thioredoxin-dependent hydroperoxide peroxidase [Halosimplex carlsbadense 2-9-1]